VSPVRITDRQARALLLLSEGYSYKQAAKRLEMSHTALSTMLSKTYANLGADSAAHAVRIGFEIGLLSPGRTYRVQEEVDALTAELARVYRALAVANGERHTPVTPARSHPFGDYLLRSEAA
jgi:DNA-binding CsgD family transcriptional regulator